MIANFEEKIKSFRHYLRKTLPPSTNLTGPQLHALSLLKNNNKLIVLMADKNLGPVLMEKKTYILEIFRQHLADSSTYCKLTEEEATAILDNTKSSLENLIYKKFKTILHPYELKYFIHHIDHSKRTPVFYGSPKIHKNKKPVPLRPIISQCGSLSAAISTYLDSKLQCLTHAIPTYVKNSYSVLS